MNCLIKGHQFSHSAYPEYDIQDYGFVDEEENAIHFRDGGGPIYLEQIHQKLPEWNKKYPYFHVVLTGYYFGQVEVINGNIYKDIDIQIHIDDNLKYHLKELQRAKNILQQNLQYIENRLQKH